MGETECMKRYFLPLLAALTLAALLAACAPEAPAPSETTPPPETTPASESVRPLTQEEVAAVNEAFASWTEENGVTIATPVSGFFTSWYGDVRELSFPDFLCYFPDDGVLGDTDREEFTALAALPDFPWNNESTTVERNLPSDLPVPIHRITRASVDAALERYAGITSADLADTSGVPYLKDYDAWYTFTSDFGPGMFVCAGGQVDEAAGTALLWSEPWANGHRAELTLQKDGENWHIRAHRNTADQALLERLANLTAEDIGYVSWYGSNEPPSAEELAELLRQAAEHPIDHDSLTLNGSATDVVWTLDCYLAPKDQETYSGDDALYLQAGLEENVVEVFGGANLPGGRLHLENEALYQLLRTSMDTPDDLLADPASYAPYQDAIAAHLDRVCASAWDGRYTSWDIVEFAREDGWTGFADGSALEVYWVKSAFRTEPPEDAAQLLAGGMYVDSQLRAYGLDANPLLVVAVPPEGEPYPLAFVPWDWWGELPLAGLDTLEEAIPVLDQAGELCVELK